MGAFGHKIFEDDFALDVKDAYLDYLFDGLPNVEATEKLQNDFEESLRDGEERITFWLALAETQWDKGRLVESVLENALEILEKPVCADTWGSLTKKRESELARLNRKLRKNPPNEKKLVRRVPKLQPGDVFRFSLDRPGADGKPVYFYGRVLVDHHAAFYSNSSLSSVRMREYKEELDRGIPNARPRSTFEPRDVLEMDVVFIGSCYAGFYDRIYKVVGNVPLEPRFNRPIRFYHRSVGSRTCSVFDIFNPTETVACDISELNPQIEQWSATDHKLVLQRLGILGR